MRGAAQAPKTGSAGSLGDVALTACVVVEGEGTGVDDWDRESERRGTGVEAGCANESSVGLIVNGGDLRERVSVESTLERERGEGMWLDDGGSDAER